MSLEAIDLHDPAGYLSGPPFEAFARLRHEAPVFRQEVPGGLSYWALTRHADVLRVSADPETFSSQRGGILDFEPGPDALAMLRGQLLCMDPPAHGELRRKLLPAFAPSTLQPLEARVRTIVVERLERALGADDFDFVDLVAAEIPSQVFGELMDCPREDRRKLRDWGAEIVKFNEPEHDAARGHAAAIDMGSYAFRLAQERRGGTGRDLASLMVNATLGGEPLGEADFAAFFVQFAVAGHDTTKSLLAGGLQALAEHPAAWRELAVAPAAIPSAVEELLRFTTPLHYFRRTATRDVELHGQKIHEGEAVVMFYSSANRDEAVFDQPDRLDVARDPNPHLAFGWGEHFCLGARLARLEARVFLEELLDRVQRVELTGAPRRIRSNLFNGPAELPVRLHPR